MSPLERLRRLAERVGGAGPDEEPDLQAAAELWREARRAQSLADMAVAAVLLRDTERLGEVGAALWDAADWDALQALCRGFGFGLRRADALRLDVLLDERQAGVRVRRVGRAHVLTALGNARRNAHRYDAQHGGDVPNAPRSPKTMLVFAVRGDRDMVVGIGQVGAKAPNPATAWPELRPWSPSQHSVWNSGSAAAWSNHVAADRVAVPRIGDDVEGPAPAPEVPPPVPARAVDQLAAWITGPPSADAFKAAIGLLDKWPKSERGARPDALAHAVRSLSAWPVECRPADRNTLTRLATAKARDTDALRVALSLDPFKEDSDVDRLCAPGASAGLRALHLRKTTYERIDVPLRRLFEEAELADLEHLVLEQLTLTRGAELFAELARHETFPKLRRLEVVSTNLGGRRDLDNEALASVHAGFALSGLESLRLRFTSIRPQGIEGLCRSGALHVSRLVLDGEVVQARGAAALAGCATLDGLRHLVLHRASLDAEAAEHLVGAAFWQSLETLALGGDTQLELGADGARIVCRALPPTLQVLDLSSDGVDAQAAVHLAVAGTPPLRRVLLAGNPLGRDGLEALVGAPWLEGLEVLDLARTGVDDHALERLAARPMAALRALNLAGNALSERGIRTLMATQTMPLLSELSLAGCGLDAAAMSALRGDGLPTLQRLDLSGNRGLGDEGARRLAEVPRCEGMRAIDLEQTGIGASGLAALDASSYTAGRFGGLPGHVLAATHEPWLWSRE